MSTSSMATALAETDPTMSDDIDIRNQIYILVTTQGDGTQLGPSSFKEQDVVKLHIGLGQKHS